MSAGEYCTRDVIVVESAESVRDVAGLMRQYHVGDAVVVETKQDMATPIGILTDRDIVTGVVAKDVDLATITVGDVMSADLTTVTEETGLMDALKLMRTKGVRRLPVVNNRGMLEGILSVDDILELIAEQMTDIVTLIGQEAGREKKLRSD